MTSKRRFYTWSKNIRASMRKRRLLVALSLALAASIGLTVISVGIYNLGGFYRYDLSRPGYEKERTEISRLPSDVTYDTTSPVTKKAVEDFIKELDKHSDNLEQYTSFDDGGLSDEDLGITPRQPPIH